MIYTAPSVGYNIFLFSPVSELKGISSFVGLGDDLAHSSLRFSLGRFTTEEEIDQTIAMISKGVNHMRDLSPIWEMFKEGIDLDAVEWSEH